MTTDIFCFSVITIPCFIPLSQLTIEFGHIYNIVNTKKLELLIRLEHMSSSPFCVFAQSSVFQFNMQSFVNQCHFAFLSVVKCKLHTLVMLYYCYIWRGSWLLEKWSHRFCRRVLFLIFLRCRFQGEYQGKKQTSEYQLYH